MLRSKAALVAAALLCGCSRSDAGVGDASDVRPDLGLTDVVIDGAHFDVQSDASMDVPASVDVVPFQPDAPTSDTVTAPDASADAAATDCTTLAEDFARIVRDLETCTYSSDCTLLVCETLCCTCQVYVNPSAGDPSRLDEIRAEWDAAGCGDAGLCAVSMPCTAATSAVCSTGYRCVTVRAAGGA